MEKKKSDSGIGACEKCGKLVVFNKFTLCYDCRKEEKAGVDKALDFLKTHRGASLNIIADATGVDPKIILKLIRGGRMETQSRENVEKIKGKSDTAVKDFRQKKKI
jgi:hypothetical protein